MSGSSYLSPQRVHFLTVRYGLGDVEKAPEVEFHLGADGGFTVTGLPTEPVLLDRHLSFMERTNVR